MIMLPPPTFTKKDGFILVGLCSYGAFFGDDLIVKLWDRFIPLQNQIQHVRVPNVCYGLEFYDQTFHTEQKWGYLCALEVSQLADIPMTMVAKTIPPHEYAVFTHRGKIHLISQTFTAIYQTWLPNSDYELANDFDFEYYDDHRFKGGMTDDSETDIYIPIKPKAISS